MSEHTPYRWEIEAQRPCDVFVTRKDTDPHLRMNICQVWGRSGDEATANARLIARAPLMYEALQRINTIIFAQGLALGSEDYFIVRQLCCDALRLEEGGTDVSSSDKG